MKIVQIITRSDNVGGAQMHVLDLTIMLQKCGHDVTILVGGDGPFIQLLNRYGIKYKLLHHLIRSIHPIRDWAATMEIYSLLKQLKPDIVATHSSKAGWLGRIAGKMLGIPTLFTAHGWSFAEGVPRRQRQIYLWAEKLAARLAARIITVSNHDLELAMRCKVASAERLVAIHNGIPDMENSLSDPQGNPPRLVMVARFEEQKDHPTLFQALAHLRDSSWQMDLIGDGPLRPQAEAMVRELQLEHKIRFLGECKEVPRLLTHAQAFVLISNWEGFPISILEAMRAGLPVIASDVGGVCESVVDGVNGFLIPRGDAILLSVRIKQLIDDPELRAQLGSAGRSLFEEKFTAEQMNDKILSLYESVIQNNHELRERRGIWGT